jgi:hypothetical protein
MFIRHAVHLALRVQRRRAKCNNDIKTITRLTSFELLGSAAIDLPNARSSRLRVNEAMGVTPTEVAGLFEYFNPGAAVPTRFKRLTDADYDRPSWELGMARKDARLMQAEADAASIAPSMLPAVAARMNRLIAEGYAHDDWTVVAKEFVVRSKSNGTVSIRCRLSFAESRRAESQSGHLTILVKSHTETCLRPIAAASDLPLSTNRTLRTGDVESSLRSAISF